MFLGRVGRPALDADGELDSADMIAILGGLLLVSSAEPQAAAEQLEQIAQAVNRPHDHGTVDFRNAVVIGNTLTVDLESAGPVGGAVGATTAQIRQMVCANPVMHNLLVSPAVELRFKVIAPDLAKPMLVTVRGADCAQSTIALYPVQSNTTSIAPAPSRAPAPTLPTPAVGGLLQSTTPSSNAPKNILAQIIKYLRGSLKDPYSIRDMRLCKPEADGSGWSVNFQLNAKNSYGAYAGATYTSASFTNGTLIHIGSPNLGPELNAKLLSMTAGCRAVSGVEIKRLLAATN